MLLHTHCYDKLKLLYAVLPGQVSIQNSWYSQNTCLPSLGFFVAAGWEGAGLFVLDTVAVSFLAAAEVCWGIGFRVVMAVVEESGLGDGARMGGDRGLVVEGGEGEAPGEEGGGRVLPGTKTE